MLHEILMAMELNSNTLLVKNLINYSVAELSSLECFLVPLKALGFLIYFSFFLPSDRKGSKTRVQMGIITVDDFVQVALKSFKHCGLNLIPVKAKTKKEMIQNALKAFYFWFSIVNVLISIIFMVVHVWICRENMELVISTLPNIVNAPFIIFKIVMVYWHKNRVIGILKGLTDNFPTTNSQQNSLEVKKYLKQLQLFIKVYGGLMIIVYISLIIFTVNSYIFNGTSFLPVTMWLPFSYGNDIVYILVCFWISWISFNVETLSFGVDLLLFALVTMVTMMYNSLRKESEIMDVTETSIKAFVERHEKINALSVDLENTFSETFLYNFMQSSFLLCFVAFELSSASKLSVIMLFIPYLMTALNQIFLICYLGQTLIESSVGIATGIFNCTWYTIEDPKLKRAVLLLLLRSQKAQKLTAKKFRVISLESFTSVRKSF